MAIDASAILDGTKTDYMASSYWDTAEGRKYEHDRAIESAERDLWGTVFQAMFDEELDVAGATDAANDALRAYREAFPSK